MKYKRLILGSIVLILLISSMIYSLQAYDINDQQIKKCQLLFQNPDQYINSQISFCASIYKVDTINKTLRVAIEEEPYNYPVIVIKTGNLDIPNLKKGDLIDVIGILDGKNNMTATTLWLNTPQNTYLIYLISLPAIPLVGYLFFKTQKFDTTTWRFKRRKKNG
jgi:hypothetical protein